MTTPQELIEKYFNQSILVSEEGALFEMLENDPTLKTQFELEKDLQKALISKKKDTLKSMLKNGDAGHVSEEINEGYEDISENKKTFNFKYLIAALLVIALGTTLFFTFFSNSLSNEELFANNFEPYRNIIAPITRGDNDRGAEKMAFASYEQGNYNEAINFFNTLFLVTEKPYYLFYQANAMLKLGNTEEAISIFKEHQEYKDDFYEKSRWYLALAYLKIEDEELALPLFEELVSNKGYEWKRAKKILKQLKD